MLKYTNVIGIFVQLCYTLAKAMEDIPQLQKTLKRGDKQRIAELTGSSLDMVIKVLKEERPATATKGRMIVEAARMIIDQRRELEAYFAKRRKKGKKS